MAQLSDDCFAFGGPLLGIEEAVALIAERVAPVDGVEDVPLAEADGRVLARDVVSGHDLPPFDNSAVDGYGVRFSDLALEGETVLPVRGRVIAGSVLPHPAAPGEAVRIFTGAPMPQGADTVFMQEDTVEEVADGGVRVRLPPGLKQGANRRLAGEDVKRGGAVLPAGRILAPQDVALAAAVGLAALPVRRRLKVALFSTGNELTDPGGALGQGVIYDANRFLLIGMLKRFGISVSDLGILRDDTAKIAKAIAKAAKEHDLVLTSGGVSTGEEDHVKAAVESQGKLVFWRVGIKPGRPVAMGVVSGTPFIGLPGNPVAVFVTCLAIVKPLIASLSGAVQPAPRPLPVEAAFAYRKKAGRREYVRVRLEKRPDGLHAHKHPQDGAGVLTSLTETDGLVELDEEMLSVVPGDTLRFYSYKTLL